MDINENPVSQMNAARMRKYFKLRARRHIARVLILASAEHTITDEHIVARILEVA